MRGPLSSLPRFTLPSGAVRRHLIDEVIDPADTRDVVVRFLESARTRSAIG